MSNKHKLFIACIIFGIILIWATEPQSKRKDKERFMAFDSAVMNAQVDSVRIAYRGAGLLLTDSRELFFIPYTDKILNNGNIFVYTAEKGDSIVKPAYGDTLYLKKTSGEVLKYTFMHF